MALSARILTADANADLRLENLPTLPQSKVNGLPDIAARLAVLEAIDHDSLGGGNGGSGGDTGTPFGELNVKDFGAVGDGITDDTAAIQAAIDAANPVDSDDPVTPDDPARPLAVVSFPPGDYRTKATLEVFNKNNLLLKGRGGVVKFDRSETTKNGVLAPTGETFHVRDSTKIYFDGIRIVDHHRYPRETLNGDALEASRQGIKMDHTNDFVITNCVIDWVSGYGIQNVGASDGLIYGNHITNSICDGCQTTAGSYNLSIVGNHVKHTDDDCISVISYNENTVCYNVTVSGNNVGETRGHGINFCGSNHCVADGNVIFNTSASALHASQSGPYGIYDTHHVVFSNNIVNGSGKFSHPDPNWEPPAMGAIRVGSETDVDENGDPAGYFTDCVISGNVVNRSASMGIQIVGNREGQAERFVVKDNIIDGSESNGILAKRVTDFRIAGNMFRNTKGHGIYVWETYKTGVVKGNTVLDCGVKLKNPNYDPNSADPSDHEEYTPQLSGVFIASPSSEVMIVSENISQDRRVDPVTGEPDPHSLRDMSISNTPNTLAKDNIIDRRISFNKRRESMPSTISGSLVVGSEAAATTGGGKGVLGLRNADVVPTSNPEWGGALYVDGGELFYRGQSGTVTKIADK